MLKLIQGYAEAISKAGLLILLFQFEKSSLATYIITVVFLILTILAELVNKGGK